MLDFIIVLIALVGLIVLDVLFWGGSMELLIVALIIVVGLILIGARNWNSGPSYDDTFDEEEEE